MGLAALRKVLNPQPLNMADLRGRAVAVDANNLLWTFVTAMREPPLGPEGQPVAHLIGLTNRLRMYAEHGIRSVWVFDGPQPKLKGATMQARQARIEAAREAGNAQGSIELTWPQMQEAQALMSALGVPWLEAPGESDPQCAAFARNGAVSAAVTQDYDIALHGCPVALRNLTGNPRKPAERLHLESALKAAGLTREQLVDAAVLIGTDYNEGVKGVGPVKAMKLVREHGTLRAALDAIGHDMPEAEDVQRLFLAHPVDESFTVRYAPPDERQVADVMAAGGLSAGRAAALCEAVSKLHHMPPRQSKLDLA